VGQRRLPPSTRSRWEAKARIVRQLLAILPVTAAVVEDVQATTRPGTGRTWNASFSPVQVGKAHLYSMLQAMGLIVHLREGWQTKQLRAEYGLTKTRQKDQQTFSSHAVDAWVLAASVSGAVAPTCTRLWYVVPVQLHRRQLHRLQADHGGVRKPYGGTRSLGFRRGALVRHPRYGLCTIGGCDRARGRLSLHAYRTNKRLTQAARPAECQVRTVVAFRSWLVPLPPRPPRPHPTPPHPTQAREEGGASSPGLMAGVSAPHLDEVRRCAIARHWNVPDDGNAQEGLHVVVVRVRLERIPEEDQQVDLALRDLRADLLVASQRPALQHVDGKSDLFFEQPASRAGGKQLVLRQDVPIEACPPYLRRGCPDFSPGGEAPSAFRGRLTRSAGTLTPVRVTAQSDVPGHVPGLCCVSAQRAGT
jgi:hypothetical protein